MTLSSRAEAAQPEETEALLMELWDVAFPVIPPDTRAEYLAKYSVFESLHNIPEAQLSAALMCLPEGWEWNVSGIEADRGMASLWRASPEAEVTFEAAAPAPAPAMIAAIAKMMEAA